MNYKYFLCKECEKFCGFFSEEINEDLKLCAKCNLKEVTKFEFMQVLRDTEYGGAL